MIRRFFALSLLSLIAIASAAVPVSAQQQMQAASNVAGTWKVSATGAHFQNGAYAIQQVNQSIIGKNPAGGQMQGKMTSANTVQGTWRGPTGETGWFNMHLTPDGKSFSGEYGYGGRKPTGTLIGQKVATTKM